MLKITERARRSSLDLFCGVSATAVSLFFCVGTAQAQIADSSIEPAPPAQEAVVDESAIVVTGTRIDRDGYEAPTPVSVLGAESLNAIGATNIAESVNRLPQLASSVTNRSQPAGISGGALGVNQMNLRGLGVGRTLVLLDGRRMVNSAITTQFAAPDVNNVPNALVTRVDVVTGGASAAYGSDALTGVVNFVLDHNFEGLKGSIQGGITDYGDNEEFLGTLTAGTAFSGGRGHMLVSTELAYNAGVKGNTRPFNRTSVNVIRNPAWTATNGLPGYLVAYGTGVSNATEGGLITAGPLRGVLFGQGGQLGTFDFGTVATNNTMVGGDWRYSRIDDGLDLVAQGLRATAYGRLSYEVTDNIELYAEGQYSYTKANTTGTPNRRHGNLTIRSDNPFIPAALAARMTTLGLTSFTMGTVNADIGRVVVDNKRTMSRFVFGATGDFDFVGSNWTWDTSYQQSHSGIDSSAKNNGIVANYLLAVDAVRSPSTGSIICRSTLTDPTNGCVPYNAIGVGVNTQQAINYVTGVSFRHDSLRQSVAQVSLRGEPFNTWAGPVSVAFGAEHRKESVSGAATALDEATAFFTGNYRATNASYNVTEGFLETVVPLAKDIPFAKSLDLNGAVRATDYSTSGYVTTWKIGATYAPIDDIKLRITRSRDIRAPNLGELFSGGRTSSGTPVLDPFTNTNVPSIFSRAAGNPGLSPEKANSLGFGVVLSPSFIPGLQGSIDFYKIDVDGAIRVPSAQSIIDLCFSGVTATCQNIERTGGVISLVVTNPQNVQKLKAKGLDFELSYRKRLSDIVEDWGGELSLRAYATRFIDLQQVDNGVVTEGAGAVGRFAINSSGALVSPNFRSMVSATYKNDALNATVSWRHVGSGVYNNAFTQCNTGCPTGSRNSIDQNYIEASDIFDIGIAYRPFEETRDLEFFIAVDNVFNTDPPIVAGDTVNGYYQGQVNFDYDRIGRTFRTGVRFKL